MLLRAINADITPTAKLLAAALYAIGPEGGAAPAEEVLTLIGIRTPGALRHLRTELADAHIASTRLAAGQLTWQWIGAPQPAAARPTDARVPQTRTAAPVTAVTPAIARPTDAQRVPQTRTAAAPARPPDARVPQTRTADPVTPVTPAPARPTDALATPQTPRVGRLLINTINTQENLPTPLPPARDEAETERALRLLRAVSVNNGTAAEAVSRWTLRQIAAKVAEYLADRADGAVRGAGVLKTRLADDQAETYLPLADPAWNHPLLAQHIGADIAAWRAAEDRDRRTAQAARYQQPLSPRLPVPVSPSTDSDAEAVARLNAFRAAIAARLPALAISAERQPGGAVCVTLPAGASARRITVANLAARHLAGDTIAIIEAP